MEVILMEPLAGRGVVGDVVKVKGGYGRFLVRYGRALIATVGNREVFAKRKAEIEKSANEKIAAANKLKEAIEKDGVKVVIARQASEEGRLYGAVSTRDIAAEIDQDKYPLKHTQMHLGDPIKELGEYEVVANIYHDVSVTIKVDVVREGNVE